jgi:asparagine synthase (glutamine-hydrolysing)
MCGIAGFVWPDAAGLPSQDTRRSWLSAMTGSLAHRGPDGEGLLLDGPAALGHRRLSIIDLSAGAQPMRTPMAGPWSPSTAKFIITGN